MAGIVERLGDLADRNARDFRLFLSDELVSRNLSPEDITAARAAMAFVVRNADARFSDLLQLEGAVNEAFKILEVKAQSRRNFFRGVVRYGGSTAVAALGVAGFIGLIDSQCVSGPRAWDLEFRQELDANFVLGTEPSSRTFAGWTVRYSTKEESTKLIPTNLISDPLQPDRFISLVGSKLTDAENTGLRLESHIRTTDNAPVGRLAIFHTNLTSTSTAPGADNRYISERWVLRDAPTETTDANILVFEKPTLAKYIGILRSKSPGNEKPNFVLREYVSR